MTDIATNIIYRVNQKTFVIMFIYQFGFKYGN